jgi:putative membrane protein insertion efficiency factor
LTFLAYQRLSTHFGHWYSLQSESKEEKDRVEQVTDDAMDDFEVPKTGAEEQVSSGMVAAIGVYKNFISPLLPPACRFVPTCSQYGVEAIQTFGPTKGGILTAWRLMRCSPFGGKGYDPPQWPPVFYTYSSY